MFSFTLQKSNSSSLTKSRLDGAGASPRLTGGAGASPTSPTNETCKLIGPLAVAPTQLGAVGEGKTHQLLLCSPVAALLRAVPTAHAHRRIADSQQAAAIMSRAASAAPPSICCLHLLIPLPFHAGLHLHTIFLQREVVVVDYRVHRRLQILIPGNVLKILIPGNFEKSDFDSGGHVPCCQWHICARSWCGGTK